MRLLPLFGALLAAAADPGQVRPRIVGGAASDAKDDATVMLVHLDPATTTASICTASLVAPRLLLTARHCVAAADDDVACNVDGSAAIGAVVHGNYDAENLYVFTGKDRPRFVGLTAPALDPAQWRPAGRGAAIIDDGATTLCNHDLALVLLEAPVEGVPIASLRLDGDARAGEKLLTVGWGVSSSEIEPQTRQRRDGVTVKRVGPDQTEPILTPSEFLFDESICVGDSGGPVFDQSTTAIVGVVSRGGNGLAPGQGGLAAGCVDADNLATKLAPFKTLIEGAFTRAGAAPRLEPKSDDGSSSCSIASNGRQSVSTLFFGAAIAATALLRRRRKRT